MKPPPAVLDGGAMLLSGLCMLHCLLLPVALTLLPIISGTWLAAESFHRWLLGLILPTSSLALCWGCRQHRDGLVGAAGAAGLLLLLLAGIAADTWLSDTGERGLTLLGGLTLAYAHWRNFRRCRSRRCEESGHPAAC
ncbi:MAG TPA: MerC domain-containing protein [Nevskiales bacterium]|nr:MerC domain-containing protein [Nevskiales bacterium]